MTNKIKVAVIGYGYLGQWHAEKAATSPCATLSAIVEKSPVRKELAEKKHPGCKIVDNIKDVLPEIDAAIIVAPTSLHFQFIKELLSAGKHILCEKPICSSIEEVALIEQALLSGKGANLVLQVGHSERFSAAWELLPSILDTATESTITTDQPRSKRRIEESVYLNRLAPFKARALDVDVVQDLMIHDLDLLMFLFKETPIDIKAYGHKIVTSEWDEVCAYLTFPSGRFAAVRAARNFVRTTRSLEITNSQGSLCVDLAANEISYVKNLPEEGQIKKISFPKRDHLAMEQECFYRSIIDKRPPVISFADGLLAVKLVERILADLNNNLSHTSNDHLNNLSPAFGTINIDNTTIATTSPSNLEQYSNLNVNP